MLVALHTHDRGKRREQTTRFVVMRSSAYRYEPIVRIGLERRSGEANGRCDHGRQLRGVEAGRKAVP